MDNKRNNGGIGGGNGRGGVDGSPLELKVEPLFDSPYIRVADLQYAPGKHYYDASRRRFQDIVAVKSDQEFKSLVPDGVSCVVVLELPGEEPKLLLSYEYRYPAGRFLLSLPAGLIDQEVEDGEDPVLATAVREIREETGLSVGEGDRVIIVNPLVFSTPGMTDESNAFVCAVLHPKDLSDLSQKGAVGSEIFGGFELVTKESARELLDRGRDQFGNFYPLVTWAALLYFAADMWK